MNSKKDKIAIILANSLYVRNYLLTDALKEIEKNNELILLFPESLSDLRNDFRFKKYKIKIYKYHKLLNNLARFNNELSLFKNCNLSKDFYFRIKRKYNHSPHLNDGTLFKRRIDHRIKVFILKKIYQIIANSSFQKLLRSFSSFIFSKYSPIQKFLKSENLKVLMCPCSVAGTEEFDLSSYSSNKINPTKTLLIIDNWDNLSSKYVMSYQPTHTVVWGEQTRLHGIIYQNIDPDKISALGTPRFYCYSKDFKLKYKKNIKLPNLPKKYILFLGSQTYYNENIVLEELKRLIKDRSLQFEIIYRPHPWREKASRKIEFVKDVIIDPTLEKDSERIGSMLLPKIELYNHIISNASLIIGGCTSMIVEASLMRKPYLLLAHDDGNPIQSPFKRYIFSEHQNLTAILNNVSVCYSLQKLYEQIIYLTNKEIEIKDPVLDYIISPKYSEFGKYLYELIKEKLLT